ncbi:hypothetical protein AVEN_104744-1 [Araneus ventricosus]|uniref:Uncharacterized protein n=1 Tax=Araneus ventricosus TaxID=182803 RepID=A0A4Y2MNB6_ARAVE|nr:hypothetical protein AVEN_104744-1 [Araneus ventricosus]
MKKYSVKEEDVANSVHHLMRHYSNIVAGALPVEIDYDAKSTCLGYLHRYAPCHTALVFEAMSSILKLNLPIVSSVLNSERVNITFLGSGPGNDMIGFFMSLFGYHQKIEHLDVTNVDKISNWEDAINDTIKLFKRIKNPKFIKERSIFEVISVTSNFISTDLTKSDEWSDGFKDKLMNTDILFLVKLLSHIPNCEKQRVLQNVNSCLKTGCLVIFIDYPYTAKIFSTLQPKLRTKYISEKQKYNLEPVCYKFESHMIPSCQAEVRLLRRD